MILSGRAALAGVLGWPVSHSKSPRLHGYWLERHGIEYDEIYFGKPNAEVYIDDRALRFSTWDAITEERLQQVARAR